MDFEFDKVHEECGVFGVWSEDNILASQWVYYGLTALQHRGQESCGIVVNNDGDFSSCKNLVANSSEVIPNSLMHGKM